MSSEASQIPQTEPPEETAPWRDKIMFFVAGLYLACVALVLPHQGLASEGLFLEIQKAEWFWPNSFIARSTIIVLEGFAGLFPASDPVGARIRRFLFIILLPPLRMAFSVARPNDRIWIPMRGWFPVGKESAEKMELTIAIPMLLITLLIIPVLIVEYGLSSLPEKYPAVGISLHLLTGLIWFAFSMEFVILLGIAEKKFAFCKKHWINIVIIILPMIAFFRMLRILRVGRVARLGKMVRVYRLRGAQARALRVMMLFNVVERLLHSRNPERYLKHLELRIEEKEKEVAELRERAEEQRQRIAEKQAAELESSETAEGELSQ